MVDFKELYQEIIMDHNKSPKNFREMTDATKKVVGKNPMCGDNFTVFVKVEDGMVVDCSFQGSGCAISKASTSVMTQFVKGKSVEDADKVFDLFVGMVKGEVDADEHKALLGKLCAFAGISEFPVRVKCATLSWHAMHEAVSGDGEEASTE